MKKESTIWVKLLRYGLPILLTVLWLGFIFSNSSQSGEASGEQSKQVQEVVNEVAQSVGIKKPITEKTIRTGAHFTEFFVFALLECWILAAFGGLRVHQPIWRPLAGFGAVIADGALMACIDETIQRFSSGRAAEWKDVGIDTLGAILAAILVFGSYLAARMIVHHKEKKRASA